MAARTLWLLVTLGIVALIAASTAYVLTRAVVTLQISAETDKATYSPGEPVYVQLEVLNTGTGMAEWESYGCGTLDFRVLDPEGTPVYDSLNHRGCILAGRTYTLPPGEIIREAFTWDQSEDGWSQVPMGRDYSVRGLVRGSPRFTATFVSATVHIKDFEDGVSFALRAGTDQESYGLGDLANVTVTLTNVGTATASLYLLQPCSVQFVILDPANAIAYDASTRSFECHNRAELVLAPGAMYVRSMVWNLKKGTGEFVTPGRTYRVLPQFDPWFSEVQRFVSRTEIATFDVV